MQNKKDPVIYFSSRLSQRAKSHFIFLHSHYYCFFRGDDLQQYHSCTDYYRTQQFKLLGDEAAATKIHSLKFGDKIQSTAQKLEEPLMRSEKWKMWEDSRVNIMRKAIKLKFEQNPRLLYKLIMTSDKKLIEDNPKDPFW